MNSKINPGPWRVREIAEWPFGWEAVDKNGEVVFRENPVAYSTKAKSLSDMFNAVGFSFNDREEAIEALNRQKANFYLRAAAPALLDNLQKLEQMLRENNPISRSDMEDIRSVILASTENF